MKFKYIKLRFIKPKYKKILVLDNATFYRNKFFKEKNIYNILIQDMRNFIFLYYLNQFYYFF